ncbi:MAG: Mrp/NBP35 family ATP-binding protein [Peptococcaceae bacterium]|nr:Mrp/NBP35 family ATP-binding protein [Peptococcaceae bacterium]MBO5114809.1 Mrp/NBP35 family ATP-binding protein [Peptococcaceae bacterium]MBO5140557.1 Mrp/NBP35 family ATP-binding protein [Peptococcaceae bacterium]MBO5301007.1 Mrp/NBP35 family ATP-binding protein [Peptococcaceae bacterium]MBO5365625.1 Mrp/NBP35 family ATP-binding protein [Peptococcaceae bacterium]
MSSCSGCSSQGSCDSTSCSGCSVPQKTQAQQLSNIKNVIVVMSGKGGVGKSSFSSLIAIALNKKGYKVGILDGDITGPSIPKLFGLHGNPQMSEFGAYPMKSENGISVMSMNLLLPNDDEPVVWRGPVISGVIKQFWEEVIWGEIDYLVVDLPPGTGDATLTILQNLPVNGVYMVTSPQDLANMIVRKGIKMVEMMNIPVLGIAENMSYLSCPDCGKKIHLFGESNIAETCTNHKVPLIGKFPLDPQLAQLGDAGKIESYEGAVLDILMENIDEFLPVQN